MTAYCIRHQEYGQWWTQEGWKRSHEGALQFDWEQAQRVRNLLGGASITSVPRHNGYCLEWDDIQEAAP